MLIPIFAAKRIPMQSQVIIQQIIIAGLIISVGAIGAKANVIHSEVRNAIARLVYNITLPLLILTTFSNNDISREIVLNGLWIIIFSAISFMLLFLLGKSTSLFLRLKEGTTKVHIAHTMFGNIIYLGFPLLNALYPGKETLLYAALYYLVSSMTMWTIGILILSNNKTKGLKENIKNLLNPNTIAFSIGLTLLFSGIKIPELLYKALSSVGNTTSEISFLYIGAVLMQTDIRGTFKRIDVYLLSLNKLIIAPVIMLLTINYLIVHFSLPISELAKAVVVLECAMPCMTMVVIIAKTLGADDQKAAENVFISTLFSLLTLPLLSFLIQWLYVCQH